MPKAPPKLHQRGPRLPVRETRKSATARGYDHRWRKLADGFVQAYPVCVLCLAQGRINRGAMRRPSKRGRSLVVDHIEPHRGDSRLFFARENWQTLCAVPCHDVIKRRLEQQPGAVRPRWFDLLATEIAKADAWEHIRQHADRIPPAVRAALPADRGVVGEGERRQDDLPARSACFSAEPKPVDLGEPYG